MGSFLKFFILLGLFSSSGLAFGANTPSAKKTPTLSEIRSLKAEVSDSSKKLTTLKNEMASLEKELGERNQKLVNLFELKRKLDGKINELSEQIARKNKALQTQRIALKRVLRSALVSQMSSNVDPAVLLSQKYLIKGLQKKNKELESTSASLSTLTDEHEALIARFNEYQKVEGNLSSLLRELETDKNAKASEYVNLSNDKKEKEGMLSQYQAMFLADKKGQEVREKVGMLFKSPVEDYKSISYKNKGVTFLHAGDERVNVKASGDGKVVYSGDLSNYGNVVMIDHGNETRSVILGKFAPTVKKGDTVKTGELVARTTKQAAGSQGKLYFEVRIKNQIQNTVLLLDELATSQKIASSSKL